MNNFNGNKFAGVADSQVGFNKRVRYTANNLSGNSSSRFKYQNHSAYQCPQNRNNVVDCYQSTQYEIATNRHKSDGVQKRHNLNYQKPSKKSSYSHCSVVSSSLSPPSASSSSSFIACRQNVLNSSTSQLKVPATQTSSQTIAVPNSQHEQLFSTNIMDSPNYYRFGYNNFFPPFNADVGATASGSSYGMVDGISPFIWQTITSTPPPKLPQPQPPLPQHQPLATVLPPLPSSDNLPPLPPPPPLPSTFINATSDTVPSEKSQKHCKVQDSAAKTIVKIKTKRKAMSMRYKLSKLWSEKNALLALEAEAANTKKAEKDIILIIRFPDPEISRDIVKCYSPDIESVHFQLNFAPRYCLVHLKPGTDVEETIDNLSKIPFGTGFLSVEIKQLPIKPHSTKPNEVDPFTLYVGNLPTTIACKTLKEHFPGAARIDIGFAQRMKYTRYAFIRYQSVQQAIEAYKRMLDAEIGGRTITIRFRRLTAARDNKDDETGNNSAIQYDVLSEIPMASAENLPTNNSEDLEPTNSLKKTNIADSAKDNVNTSEETTVEIERTTDNNITTEGSTVLENNIYINVIEPLSSADNEKIPKADTNDSHILNVKSEPDIDPDDIVISNRKIVSFSEATNSNIKQEEENLALYMEFFEKPSNANDICANSNRNDIGTLSSTACEIDTISTLCTNSLGDFLQNCRNIEIHQQKIQKNLPPEIKRKKIIGDSSLPSIKPEPLENNSFISKERSKDSTAEAIVKQEIDENTTNSNVNTNKNSSQRNYRCRTDKTIPADTENSISLNNFEDYDQTSNDNDDIVPPTALFFRSDYQKKVGNLRCDCNYDEFYATKTNVPVQLPSTLVTVKKEPSEILTYKRAIVNNQNKEKSKTSNVSNVDIDASLNKETYPINFSTLKMNNTGDNNTDLVPLQNLLGSYQSSKNYIKQEIELDDIYATPFHTTNSVNEELDSEMFCSSNDSSTNLQTQSNATENILNFSKLSPLEDIDDDVVIISDSIQCPSKTKNSRKSQLSNFFLAKHTNLVSLKDKPISISSERTISKLMHHNNLDRLYDQLDADSDSEL